MTTKYLQKAIFFLLVGAGVFVLGGFGGVMFDRFVVPKLALVPGLADWKIFKELGERVTIINKTEQVVIREDDSIEKIVSQPATAVVSIVSLPDESRPTRNDRQTMNGVLLTNDGLMVTYREQAPREGERYRVFLFDGSDHPATAIGHDFLTNLSFFRLEGSVNTPAIAFANSDDARVGKRLILLGNASLAYQHRLSAGMLGDIDRTFNLSGKTVSSSEKWEGVFRLTDGVGRDFVGGPAVGFNGEMVGLTGTLVIDNIPNTFIIPANAVRQSLDRAVGGTLAVRPALGLYYLPITKTSALTHGLSRDHGALVYSSSGKTGLAMIADSPAMRAGLLAGDIVVAVNGRDVDLDHPLSGLLGQFVKGERIELSILRDGEERKMEVAL